MLRYVNPIVEPRRQIDINVKCQIDITVKRQVDINVKWILGFIFSYSNLLHVFL